MQFAAAAPVSVAGCVMALVAAFVNWNWRHKPDDLAFDADAVQRRGQWYRVFTAPLAHSSLAHLVISILGWVTAAGLVELTTGSARMLLLTVVLLVRARSTFARAPLSAPALSAAPDAATCMPCVASRRCAGYVPLMSVSCAECGSWLVGPLVMKAA